MKRFLDGNEVNITSLIGGGKLMLVVVRTSSVFNFGLIFTFSLSSFSSILIIFNRLALAVRFTREDVWFGVIFFSVERGRRVGFLIRRENNRLKLRKEICEFTY